MVVKNLPANAGDMSLIPGLGRSHRVQSNKAHVPQLLSPHATTIEYRVPRARAQQQKKPLQCEALEPQGKVAPVSHN